MKTPWQTFRETNVISDQDLLNTLTDLGLLLTVMNRVYSEEDSGLVIRSVRIDYQELLSIAKSRKLA